MSVVEHFLRDILNIWFVSTLMRGDFQILKVKLISFFKQLLIKYINSISSFPYKKWFY